MRLQRQFQAAHIAPRQQLAEAVNPCFGRRGIFQTVSADCTALHIGQQLAQQFCHALKCQRGFSGAE